MGFECYLNERFLRLEDAKVSVMDRGFLFGDGVYEVIPVYKKRLFYKQRHWQRLKNSLRLTGINFDCHTLTEPIQKLLENFPEDNFSLYLQITRGAYPKRQHQAPLDIAPTVFILPQRLSILQEKEGISVCKKEDFRWQRGMIKSNSLLAAVMISNEVAAANADEALLLRQGEVTEGSSSNYIFVKDKVLLTPPLNHFILSGITFQIVLELAQQHGYKTLSRPILEQELSQMDEIILCSSTREMRSVVSIDGEPVGNGKLKIVYSELRAILSEHIATGNW